MKYCLVIAPSGMGKSTAYLIPNLRRSNFCVRSFDFRNKGPSFQYNPLHRAKSLLALLIRHLRLSRKEAPTLSQLFDLINHLSFERKALNKKIMAVFSDQDIATYKAFISQEEHINSNVLSTIKTALFISSNKRPIKVKIRPWFCCWWLRRKVRSR